MGGMNPLDASFLYLEDGTAHMHIASCAVFEGPPPPIATWDTDHAVPGQRSRQLRRKPAGPRRLRLLRGHAKAGSRGTRSHVCSSLMPAAIPSRPGWPPSRGQRLSVAGNRTLDSAGVSGTASR